MSTENRTDAAFVEQEVDILMPDVILEAYPDRTYGQAFSVAPGLSPGAKTVTYRHAKGVGVAKFVDPGSREVPLVEYDVVPNTVPIRLIRLGAEYDTEDVREGQLTGRPLDRDKLVIVAEGHEALIDETAWVGSPSRGIYGVANHPNILRLVTSTTFDSNSTASAILAAMLLPVSKMVSLTKGIERPNTLALPHEQHEYVSSTMYSQAGSGDTRTILEVFLASQKQIDLVLPVHHLEGAGVGSEDVAVYYNRARTKIEHLLAMRPTRNPVAWDGTNWRVVYESKTGGCSVKKPFSVIDLEGI